MLISVSVLLEFRKWSPIPICSRVPPTFCSKRFSGSVWQLRSLIHLDLSFEHGDRHGSICNLLHTIIQLSQHHLLKMLSSLPPLLPPSSFSCFVENQVFIGVWVNIGVFDSIPLVYLSIFVPRPGCFQDYSSVVELKVRDGDAS